MKTAFQRIAVAGVLCLGLAVSAAGAQDRPAAPGGARGQGRTAGQRGVDRQKLFEQMRQRREQRLHDLLQIKPDQETAFRTFVSSLDQLRPRQGPRGGGRGAPGAPQRMPLTAPERLDRQAQRLAERQQRLQKETAAVKTFYAALTPDQRKVFDEFHAMGGRGGHGRHGWMHGRFGGGRPPGPPR